MSAYGQVRLVPGEESAGHSHLNGHPVLPYHPFATCVENSAKTPESYDDILAIWMEERTGIIKKKK